MKCSRCNGDGVVTFNKTDKNGYYNDAFFMKECPVCHGTGEIEPMTNDEWRRTCSTEEFAEWILDVSDECFDCGKSDNGDCPFGKAQGVCTCINKDSVVEWLKQPHTPKE